MGQLAFSFTIPLFHQPSLRPPSSPRPRGIPEAHSFGARSCPAARQSQSPTSTLCAVGRVPFARTRRPCLQSLPRTLDNIYSPLPAMHTPPPIASTSLLATRYPSDIDEPARRVLETFPLMTFP